MPLIRQSEISCLLLVDASARLRASSRRGLIRITISSEYQCLPARTTRCNAGYRRSRLFILSVNEVTFVLSGKLSGKSILQAGV